MATEPKTLQDAILYFADTDNCISYLVARRWKNGVVCPTCGSENVAYVASRRLWQCKTRHPKAQFSIKVGTIFEDSPIGLDKWLLGMWMLANCKNGISSYELHRATGISQKSAWFVLHRLRMALRGDDTGKLGDEVEADETFVGGKIQNMHKRGKRKLQATNDGNWGKTVVLGLLEREGRVKAAVAPTRSHYDVHANVMANVEEGSTLITDEYNAYQSLPPGTFTHEIINKLEGYVKGRVHVNGMENFWSLLKRGLKGTYVSVDPAHLQAYVDEQVFRFNNRKDIDGAPLTDSDRFDTAVRQIVGKRLTWAEVTGKVDTTRLN
ncbi:MAG: IS1595 family transposase [Bryobacteraceae bacterium]